MLSSILVHQVFTVFIKKVFKPGVLSCFSSARTFIRIKCETLCNEVEEKLILRGDGLFHLTVLWDTHYTMLRVLDQEWRVISIEIVVLLPTLVNN